MSRLSPNYYANCTVTYIRHRITYKVATITYRTRHCQQPVYLLDSLISYEPARTLYARQVLIAPHRVKTVTASRAFRVAATTIWYALPDFFKVAGVSNV